MRYCLCGKDSFGPHPEDYTREAYQHYWDNLGVPMGTTITRDTMRTAYANLNEDGTISVHGVQLGASIPQETST